MRGAAICMIINTLWKRVNKILIISRIINHDLKEVNQDNKRCRNRKRIYNQETLFQDLISCNHYAFRHISQGTMKAR